jgi:hypothetical protein
MRLSVLDAAEQDAAVTRNPVVDTRPASHQSESADNILIRVGGEQSTELDIAPAIWTDCSRGLAVLARLFIGCSSAVHRLLTGGSSAAHRRLIGGSSAAHRRLIGCSSASHRLLICFSSAAHRRVIGCSSASHWLLIGQHMSSSSAHIGCSSTHT